MSNHEHYEKLCVMASVGEISGDAQAELKAHLKRCAGCRSMLADMGVIHANLFPQRFGFEVEREAAVESRIRGLALDRITEEAAHCPEPAAQSRLHTAVFPSRAWMLLRPHVSLATSIFLVLGISGEIARVEWRHSQQPRALVAARVVPLQTTVATVKPNKASVVIDSEEVRAADEKLRQAEEAQARLELTLKQSQADRKLLEQRLQDAARNLDEANSQASLRVADIQQQLAAARANEANAKSELASFKSSQANGAMELALVRAESQDLRDKLAAQTASLDRERDLMSAGREVRDLIAARNLHIIDVYDTTGDGKVQKAFGRVFYTEGKSLVFYAYDLSPRHPATKYAYYAWGKRDDMQGGVRKLGIFYNDDQSQKRWVLQINDPQMLSAIDSVFVTLEPTNNSGIQPSGQQVLSAYLGSSPNHP